MSNYPEPGSQPAEEVKPINPKNTEGNIEISEPDAKNIKNADFEEFELDDIEVVESKVFA